MKKDGPMLSWVIVKGEVHPVAEYVGLPGGSRPEARCPVCQQLVILKLGSERVHHAAHYKSVVCAATQPETILHLNVKFHIWKQLREAKRLTASWQCAKCKRFIYGVVAENWDSAEVEYPIGAFRADVALVKDGHAICAVEVRVTHPTEPEKIQSLKDARVPIVEVQASEAIYEPPTTWNADHPLPSLLPCGERLCDSCRTLPVIVQVPNKPQPPRAYEEWEVVWMRFADCYYPSGKRFRETYKVMVLFRKPGDEAIRIMLTRGLDRKKWTTVDNFWPPWNADLAKRIQDRFLRDIHQVGPKNTIVDSPMSWMPWIGGVAHSADNDMIFPQRYDWDDRSIKWLLMESMKNTRWDDEFRVPKIQLEVQLEAVAKTRGITRDAGWERNEPKRRWENQQTGEYVSDALLANEAREQYRQERLKPFPFRP